jgi:hypothetical protein
MVPQLGRMANPRYALMPCATKARFTLWKKTRLSLNMSRRKKYQENLKEEAKSSYWGNDKPINHYNSIPCFTSKENKYSEKFSELCGLNYRFHSHDLRQSYLIYLWQPYTYAEVFEIYKKMVN